jgi:protein-tyrosine phosphatase
MNKSSKNPVLSTCSRNIEISFVGNLRDLGGLPASGGRQVARRKVYRSAEIKPKSAEDVSLLRQLTGITTVLDLRGETEIKADTTHLLRSGGLAYFNAPLIAGGPGTGGRNEKEVFSRFQNMGQFYLHQTRQQAFGRSLVGALEFIADPLNQPVLFHCAVGKDRTGMLSAAILSVLGVAPEDIIADYHLSTPYMLSVREEMKLQPAGRQMLESLPAYCWEAATASMALVLSELNRQYGSFKGYLETNGAASALFQRLEAAFLASG